MASGRVDAIIAGVNKAGTTSLFVSLSSHPDVAPSSIKETRYFLPPRYGRPLEPRSVWDGYFDGEGDRPVRLEATPSYFYGGSRVAAPMRAQLVDPHILLLLREPVARAISFFAYQKVRLRFPVDLTITDYLAAADGLGPDAFADPDNERYMAYQGGVYADYLPQWLDTFGTSHLRVLDFQQLITDPVPLLGSVAAWLGLDPARFPADGVSAENRTTGYRNKGLQQLALAGNDRLERLLRRHPDAKRKLRDVYYRFNGRQTREDVPEAVRAALAARYEEPNARLATQLQAAGIALPRWLTDQTGSRGRA